MCMYVCVERERERGREEGSEGGREGEKEGGRGKEEEREGGRGRGLGGCTSYKLREGKTETETEEYKGRKEVRTRIQGDFKNGEEREIDKVR